MNSERVTTTARRRVQFLVEMVEYVTSDGVVTTDERRMLVSAASDAIATVRCADDMDALARAVGRVTSAKRLKVLTDAAQASMDELPVA